MDKLDKLNKILETPTHEEVADVLKAILSYFKETVSAMEQRIANGEMGLSTKQQEMMVKMGEIMEKWNYLSSLEEKGKGMEMSHTKMSKKMAEEMGKMKALCEELKSIKASDLSQEAATLTEKRIKPFIPKFTDIEGIVRDNIRTIIQERDKESNVVIEGFKDEIRRLEKLVSSKTSGGVRRVYQPFVDDFSGETNGVKKTFYLTREPLKSSTVLVWGTDFPVVLRPTTDFTIAGKTLTLTSAVVAPSTGATLLVQYHA